MAVNEATAALVDQLAESGYSTHAIADILNTRGVETASGRGRWWHATVGAVLDRGEYRRTYMRRYRANERADWSR